MVQVIPNPEQTLGFGVQAALRVATGDIIVRCDADVTFPPGYLCRVFDMLERTDAVNVGGRQQPLGTTCFERAVAIAMITPLVAGDVRYRLGGHERPVDTIYLGAFRRDTLDAVGGVNPTLTRNQDYELNWRLRQRGETVWLDPALVVIYQPRGTLRALALQ